MNTEDYGIFFPIIFISALEVENEFIWSVRVAGGPLNIRKRRNRSSEGLITCPVCRSIGNESEWKQPRWRAVAVTSSAQHSWPAKPPMRTWLRPRWLYTLRGREQSDLGLFLCVPPPFYVRSRECKWNQALPASELPCGFPSTLRKSPSPSNSQTIRVLPLFHDTLSLCPFLSTFVILPQATPFHPHCPPWYFWDWTVRALSWNLDDFLPGRVSPDIHRVFFLISLSSHSNALWSKFLPGWSTENCTPSTDIILELCFLYGTLHHLTCHLAFCWFLCSVYWFLQPKCKFQERRYLHRSHC